MLFRSNRDPRYKEVRKLVQKVFGFAPRKPDLFMRALRHSSVQQNSSLEHNERLEFLGDAVLDSIIAEYLYANYPDADEGQMTKWKATLVSRDTLNRMADDLDITEVIEHNIGKGHKARSMSGNALEALIGAVYLHKGYGFTRKSVIKLMKEVIHEVVSRESYLDHKSALFEWAQKEGKQIDVSHREKEGHRPHSPLFEATISIDGKQVASGTGRSKKRAEQEAAEKALRTLN